MAKKRSSKERGRRRRFEPTYEVALTERDLIILQQAIKGRMQDMSGEVMDDGLSDDDRKWRLQELLWDHELDKKLRDVMPEMKGSWTVEVRPERERQPNSTR